MNQKLTVSASPHIRCSRATGGIMRDVLIALAPAMIAATVIFGWQAPMLTAICVASCVLFEFAAQKLLKRAVTVSDLSAAVTGVLLSFNLPVNIPVWIAVVGCFTAIVVVKQLFGGIGQNFANPAITARVVLAVSFGGHMTDWAWRGSVLTETVASASQGAEVVTGATPLHHLSGYSLTTLLLGNHAGSMGETCAIALLLGAAYLLSRRVISPAIPLTFAGTTALVTLLAGEDPLRHLLAGGLLLGALFMATDYATSPLTLWGKLIFGAGCGLFTALIRVFGSYPEGVSSAILFMNMLTPAIDRVTRTRPMGARKGGASK